MFGLSRKQDVSLILWVSQGVIGLITFFIYKRWKLSVFVHRAVARWAGEAAPEPSWRRGARNHIWFYSRWHCQPYWHGKRSFCILRSVFILDLFFEVFPHRGPTPKVWKSTTKISICCVKVFGQTNHIWYLEDEYNSPECMQLTRWPQTTFCFLHYYNVTMSHTGFSVVTIFRVVLLMVQLFERITQNWPHVLPLWPSSPLPLFAGSDLEIIFYSEI